MMRALAWSMVLIGIAALSGCSRMAATTYVKPDGSFTRVVRFTTSESDSPGSGLRNTFVLPAGSPWTVTKSKEKDEGIYAASRSVAKGGAIHEDVVIKSDEKGAPARILANEVTVREVSPGRYEYQETLHWKGKRDKDVDRSIDELAKAFEAMLPESPARAATARKLGRVMFREIWRAMFGPSEPLLAEGLFHPDLMGRKFSQRIGPALKTELAGLDGERPSEQKKEEILRKVRALAKNLSSSQTSRAKSSSSSSGSSSNSMIPLFFVVRLPGRIVSHNGEVDETANEVFWALYPEAVAFEDVVLTATCEVKPATRVSGVERHGSRTGDAARGDVNSSLDKD